MSKLKLPILLIIGLSLLTTSCNNVESNNKSSTSPSSYKEEKMSIKDTELANPTDFLDASGKYRENLLGGKIKINGTIKNSASVATYKDVVVRVTYYSKTKTKLGTEDYTIWEYFPPHSTKNFKLKIKNYSNVGSIGLDVVSAKPS